LMMMETQLESYVALNSPDFIFIHAGVVAVGDRAIVIPGASFSGKTTLVTALVRAGAVYYSDEFAVLDEAGRVHPYPKPLSYRPPDNEPTIDYRVEELGGTAGEQPLPVGMMIATRYLPGAGWEPRALSLGAGALALLEHAVAGRTRPEQTMRVVKTSLDRAVALEGERGEADVVAKKLLESLRAMA
jgi:hypothetical protein